MIRLFSSSSQESSEESSPDVSKSDLPDEWLNFYENMYEDIRGNAQTVNVNAKPTVDGFNIPSADHTQADLVDFREELGRIQGDLQKQYPNGMASKEVFLCDYCRHSIDILIDLLEIFGEQ